MDKKMQMAMILSRLAPDALYYQLDDEGNIIKWWDGIKQPSQKQIKDELQRMEVEKASTQYREDRQAAYPTVGEQLGLLFDDIKAGNLEKGKWVKLIEDIKSAHPKPQTQA